MKEKTGPTRRALLQRGLFVLAGAIGFSAAAKHVTRVAAAPMVTNGSLTLHGRFWHQQSQDLRPGDLPAQGERTVTYGELLDGPDGEKVGEFYSANFCMDAPFGPSTMAAGHLELHTFSLSDGSIVGTGVGRPNAIGESVYAIIGGTGRYAGATGTYVARQRPQEQGGDGTAEFTLTLTA